MESKILKAITDFSLLEKGVHVCVALSGGADSMCLLSALVRLKDELGITLTAAHFNHKIRGEEAERDEAFVREFCTENGIELTVGCGDVPEYAKQNHLSVELAARKLRYQFFESIDADLIATAHHADDNLETVLFNLTRGTALAGLCGIPPKRDKFIRPLILCSRKEIEVYCEQNKIPFVTDSTNNQVDYTRNKIRHLVVPVLNEINESAQVCAARTSASLREDADFINSVVSAEYNKRFKDGVLCVKDFGSIHAAVAKRLIAKYYAEFCEELDSLHVNAIFNICITGGAVSVSGDKRAVVRDNKLKIVSNSEKPQTPLFDVQITEAANDLFENNEKVHNLLLKNVIDCDRIVGDLDLRTKVSGDKIRLKNKNCTKTLKKLFTEYRIPVSERETWPVLSDDLGVVWVHKIGVAERCAADEKSHRIYKITVKKSFMGDFKNE